VLTGQKRQGCLSIKQKTRLQQSDQVFSLVRLDDLKNLRDFWVILDLVTWPSIPVGGACLIKSRALSKHSARSSCSFEVNLFHNRSSFSSISLFVGAFLRPRFGLLGAWSLSLKPAAMYGFLRHPEPASCRNTPTNILAFCNKVSDSPGCAHTSVVSPWAIFTSVPWLTVHEILCMTVSTSPAALGWPLPLFFTPPKGRCTSAPMHGRLT